jgi:hypothetical protein
MNNRKANGGSHHCPKCGGLIDGATGIENGKLGSPLNQGELPPIGSFSVCSYCLTPLKVGEEEYELCSKGEIPIDVAMSLIEVIEILSKVDS